MTAPFERGPDQADYYVDWLSTAYGKIEHKIDEGVEMYQYRLSA